MFFGGSRGACSKPCATIKPMDPITIAAAAKVASSVDKSDGLLKRVLGPPADALGVALGRFVEARTQNVGRILENADTKLGARGDRPEKVPMRIAGLLMEDCSYCDEPIMVEYIGGVLASSRSGVSRDDRGAKWMKLVLQLSTYELRAHYIAYQATQLALRERNARRNWTDVNDAAAFGPMCIPYKDFMSAMDFVLGEPQDEIVSETVFGLSRAGLLDQFSLFTPLTFEVVHQRQSHPTGMLTFMPTVPGIHLFLYALGMGDLPISAFDDPEVNVPGLEGVACNPATLFVDVAPFTSEQMSERAQRAVSDALNHP